MTWGCCGVNYLKTGKAASGENMGLCRQDIEMQKADD